MEHYIYMGLGMCGMDFSSSVRFRFGFEKNHGFGSVLKNRRFGSIFFSDGFLTLDFMVIYCPTVSVTWRMFVRMAQILTICMRQVRFWENPWKLKFRVWPFGFGSVFKNRKRTKIRFPHIHIWDPFIRGTNQVRGCWKVTMSHKYAVISHKLQSIEDRHIASTELTGSALLIGTISNDLERPLILISHNVEHCGDSWASCYMLTQYVWHFSFAF